MARDADRMIVQLTAAELRALVSDAVKEALDAHGSEGEPDDPVWFTSKGAANRLRITMRTLNTLVARGLLPAHRVMPGGTRRFHVDDIDAVLKTD